MVVGEVVLAAGVDARVGKGTDMMPIAITGDGHKEDRMTLWDRLIDGKDAVMGWRRKAIGCRWLRKPARSLSLRGRYLPLWLRRKCLPVAV